MSKSGKQYRSLTLTRRETRNKKRGVEKLRPKDRRDARPDTRQNDYRRAA